MSSSSGAGAPKGSSRWLILCGDAFCCSGCRLREEDKEDARPGTSKAEQGKRVALSLDIQARSQCCWKNQASGRPVTKMKDRYATCSEKASDTLWQRNLRASAAPSRRRPGSGFAEALLLVEGAAGDDGDDDD